MNVLEKILEAIEEINYHPEGMGCGIEDRGITDRYEACEYGWDEAIEAVIEMIGEVQKEPTAYDVEKVIEQLQNAGSRMSFYGTDNFTDKRISLEEAIEIVRKGGIEK